ncbi:MAG: hypothetical protein LBM93_03990, partial [Oscillospiraceae bacterium]|nr:hypothetical protein [Oscillospiraceae bacterium]
DDFIKWLVNQLNKKKTPFNYQQAEIIVEQLKSKPLKLRISLPESKRNVFACKSVKELRILRQIFEKAPNYKLVNFGKNSFTNALKIYEKYLLFLEKAKTQTVTSNKLEVETPHNELENNNIVQKSPENIEEHSDNKAKSNKGISLDTKVENIILVFQQEFKNGYNTTSKIKRKQFNNRYQEKFNLELDIDDTALNKIIKSVGIEIDTNVYLHTENSVPNDVIDEIKLYISEFFTTNLNSPLYFETIFTSFQQVLCDYKIYNSNALKMLLTIFCKEYYFDSDFIALTTDNLFTAEQAVIQYLKEQYSPVNWDSITQNLSYPQNDIQKAILSKKIVSVEKKTWTYIENFGLDDEDIAKIKGIIKAYIDENTILLKADFLDLLPLNIREKYPPCYDNSNAWWKVTEYYLGREFVFTAITCTNKGENLYVANLILKNFNGSKQITLQELSNYMKSLGVPPIEPYLDDFYKSFIRVKQDLFINNEQINFDVEEIDSIIEKNFMQGVDFIGIGEIVTFISMPYCGYTWNEFLFKSYLQSYSRNFTFATDSDALKSCFGAVIRKSIHPKKYDELLALAVINAKLENASETDIKDFLKSKKYISRRNNFKEILGMVKKISLELGE